MVVKLTSLDSGLGLFSDGHPHDDGSVSKSDFARKIGVTKSRISQLVAQGMPVLPTGRIDPAAALVWIKNNIDPSRRQPRGQIAAATGADSSTLPQGTSQVTHRDSVTTLRAAKLAEEIQLTRLKREEKSRSLVDRADAEALIFARARLERDAHLNWVMRVAPQLATVLSVDPNALFASLDRMMREHLEELSRTPLAVLSDGSKHH